MLLLQGPQQLPVLRADADAAVAQEFRAVPAAYVPSDDRRSTHLRQHQPASVAQDTEELPQGVSLPAEGQG